MTTSVRNPYGRAEGPRVPVSVFAYFWCAAPVVTRLRPEQWRIRRATCSTLSTATLGASPNSQCASSKKKTRFGFSGAPAMGSTWNRSDGIHSRKEAKGRGEPTVRPWRASCCTLHCHRKPTRDRPGLAQVGRTPLLHPAFPVPADNAGSNRPLWREHGRSAGRWGRRSR